MSIAAARKLCRQFGIKFNPDGVHCDENETCCGDTIARLLKKHGEATMVLTLRVFTETHPGNGYELDRETITAVNAVCRLTRWKSLGLAFLDSWDEIELGELRRRAESFDLQKVGYPLWATLAALIISRIGPTLDALIPKPPPKPVSRNASQSRRAL